MVRFNPVVYIYEINNNKIEHVQNNKVKEFDGVSECNKIFENIIVHVINRNFENAISILNKYKGEIFKIHCMKNNLDDLLHRMISSFLLLKHIVPILSKGGGRNLFIELNYENLKYIDELRNKYFTK
jgi:hypothetical protein